MTDHRATEAYYDEFSDWYERDRGRGYHGLIDDLEIAIVAPFAHGARVLEVGCGTGLILSRLAAVAQHATGVDLSRGMLARAKMRGLDVVQGLANELPFPDHSFDLVCSFKVLAHVPQIETALREMARVTAPGGTLAAEFYNPYSLRYLAKRLSGPRAISRATREDAVYTRFDSARTIRAMLPPSVTLESFRGVRTLVPAAAVINVPVLGRWFRAAEFAVQDTPLAYLSGFLVAVARKRE